MLLKTETSLLSSSHLQFLVALECMVFVQLKCLKHQYLHWNWMSLGECFPGTKSSHSNISSCRHDVTCHKRWAKYSGMFLFVYFSTWSSGEVIICKPCFPYKGMLSGFDQATNINFNESHDHVCPLPWFVSASSLSSLCAMAFEDLLSFCEWLLWFSWIASVAWEMLNI